MIYDGYMILYMMGIWYGYDDYMVRYMMGIWNGL